MTVWRKQKRGDKYIRAEILSDTKTTVKTCIDGYNKYIAAVYKI